MEIWKDVVGFERAYQVSNLGRVKSKIRKGVIEQSTGLKDENGGEIYEGDLITRCRDDDLPMVVYFGEMEDSDVSFFYLGWACDEGYSLLDYDKACKIVGNIHENPELIGSERSR